MNPNYPNIIAVENLAAGYQSKIIWQDANFTIDHGEFVAVMAPMDREKQPCFVYFSGCSNLFEAKLKYLILHLNAAIQISVSCHKDT